MKKLNSSGVHVPCLACTFFDKYMNTVSPQTALEAFIKIIQISLSGNFGYNYRIHTETGIQKLKTKKREVCFR